MYHCQSVSVLNLYHQITNISNDFYIIHIREVAVSPGIKNNHWSRVKERNDQTCMLGPKEFW